LAIRMTRGSIETVVRATKSSDSFTTIETALACPLHARGVEIGYMRRRLSSPRVSLPAPHNQAALAAWKSSSAQLFRGPFLLSFATESNTPSYPASILF
jgi:hypothetical protein